jgi:DNA-binding SARP family transcriptional activator
VNRSAASLSFALLGSLEVRRDGTRIEPETPKLRTLLIDLLVHRGGPRSRDRLIDDLWGDAPPTTAVGVLQNYVSQLRKLLGSDIVRRSGTGYVMDISPDLVDVDRFAALLELARTAQSPGATAATVREALALWRGEPLADVAGAPFAQPEIVRLRELRAAARELLLEAELAQGRYRETVPALEAALIGDPLRERLWWLLMSALYRSGRQADALRAYQRARQLLVEQLGIEPSAELRELERAILQQRDDVVVPPPAPGKQRIARESPTLSGRESELDGIRRFLAKPAGLLLLSGEPGIGKTRLLEEAQARHGGLTIVSRAYEAEQGRPYGPWVDALRSGPLPEIPAGVRDGLAPLLPELSDQRRGVEDTTRLYDAVVALLRQLAGRAPLLLTIDDIHWLDERSVALLHYAVRNLRGSVPFLLAARSQELTDNAACRRMLEALRRAGAVRDLVVGPLPDTGIHELIRRVAPRADPNPIVSASNGNPLLALEMARAVVRGDDPLSGEVDALIGDRLARLSERAAALVPWLAAFGRSVRPTLLAAAYDTSVDALLEPLGELEEHGVVVAEPDGAYDLAHDLLRDTAYRHLSTPRRIMLHRRIGRALVIFPDDDDTLAADAARHADQADDATICAAASARAARRCVRLLAYDEAAAHVARGRGHARRLDARQRVVHEIRLIDVLLHPGLRLRDPGALRTELAELCALAQQLGLVDELSAGLTLLARVYHWGWGDIPRARALLQRSVDVISRADHPLVEPLLQAARCLAYLEIDMPRTRGLFDELARLGELAEASHQYHWGRGLVLAWSGEVAEAHDELQQAIRFADAHGDHWVQFECAARLALLEIEAGADVMELCAQLDPLAAKLGQRGSERQYAQAIRALAWLGDDDTPFLSSIDELTRIDARFLTPDLLGLAAEKRYRAGDLPRAEPYAERALDVAMAVHRPSEIARAHALLACIAAQCGALDAAAQHLAATADGRDQWPRHVLTLCAEAEALIARTPKEATWQ